MRPKLNPVIQSIEAKQIAQQEAFQARYVVMQAKEEKKQKIVSAEGEAARYDLSLNLISSHPSLCLTKIKNKNFLPRHYSLQSFWLYRPFKNPRKYPGLTF